MREGEKGCEEMIVNATKTQTNTTDRTEVFYDGDCPLCRREIALIERRDHDQRLQFVDIAAREFKAENYNVQQDDLMAELHARRPNGEWARGVDAFREMYAAIGWRTAVRISRLPLIRPMLDVAYRIFARNRLWLTGRRRRCDSTCDRNVD